MTEHSENDATQPSPHLDLLRIDACTRISDGLPSHVALRSIPPGWRSLVTRTLLFEDHEQHFVLRRCEEIDGELVVEADSVDGTDVNDVLRAVSDIASRTCSACGAGRASRCAPLNGLIHAVCALCRRRIEFGEDLLQVADDYFRLDGSPRSAVGAASMSASEQGKVVTPPVDRDPEPLAPRELRSLIHTIRDRLRGSVVGNEQAVNECALLLALHLGGAAPGERGARMLLLGRSGVGKTTLLDAMRSVAAECGIATAYVAALDLTSPGWSGAPSILDVIVASVRAGDTRTSPRIGELAAAMRSRRARKALVIIDEFHHIRTVDPAASSSFHEKRAEVLGSLLPLLGHGGRLVTVDGSESIEWSSDEALVICAGAFEGLLDLRHDPTTRELVERGNIPLEVASRFETCVRLASLSETNLRALLCAWPSVTSITRTCARLGIDVRVTPEAIAMAARAVARADGRLTPRTGGGWILSAIRRQLAVALDDPSASEIVVTPDDLEVEHIDPATEVGQDDDEGPDLSAHR